MMLIILPWLDQVMQIPSICNVILFGRCSFVNEDITAVTALPIMNPNKMTIQFRYAFIFIESEEGSD
jgi:hypothetical protein